MKNVNQIEIGEQQWLEDFQNNPQVKLDEVLQGLAWILPYERSIPSQIITRLFSRLDPNDDLVKLLDANLSIWLETRWLVWDEEKRQDYGLERFVTEYIDGLSIIWILNLGGSWKWLHINYSELAKWSEPMNLSKFWDLPNALRVLYKGYNPT